jgi:hypothetical protein
MIALAVRPESATIDRPATPLQLARGLSAPIGRQLGNRDGSVTGS